MKLEFVTTVDRTDLIEKGDKIIEQVWPEFMLHDAVANEYFFQLYSDFPEYQYWLLDGEEIVGTGNCIPISWTGELADLPDEGWDWALEKGFNDLKAGLEPNLLCALSITINPKYQGKGISKEMIRSMVQIGIKSKLEKLIIPVRPTLKKEFQQLPMDDYIQKRDGSQLFDPWLRVHEKMGGKIIQVCSKAMDIRGTIQDWKDWTGLDFPKTGSYEIEGALKPINIDLEKDEGIYIEPNVWIAHQL
ncbi:MAG: GNAT family N-acetyltransferase [Candidatus Cloacimonetes bacterium]|jgi:GNAT superfamily N-acetyltransferase|nr:GNAT family N-acetyltransferase [Candidatus Cloacimonadota bacterium]MBT4333112.1 GNAT family N-acetyltransferase [Candidatus Cloacimonadota bacterium]MBT4576645.1 GNAT family N-acetyltransferase [Candidatus Cloacimonadota bacterium]MBT5419990.1 GNAT family N-acetyltransferase [Candidatus Cloacimonadota bacterium]